MGAFERREKAGEKNTVKILCGTYFKLFYSFLNLVFLL